MLYLKTLGGLSVTADGAPVSGAAQQRKTLALLALLAGARVRGVSRDKLINYLWPEADTEHGRGLLKQACYALRRDLDAPELILGATELRLNPAVIASDLKAFEAAIERGDEAEAASVYAGPFLDGFYLSDSGEFERWVAAERDRLQQRARKALETLATQATARGDHRNSAEWWRRLSALDPLNARVALGLMNALAAVGDRAGALQVARVHESVLREELDAAPEAAVVELTERLRAECDARVPALQHSGSNGQHNTGGVAIEAGALLSPGHTATETVAGTANAPGDSAGATGGDADAIRPDRKGPRAVWLARVARNRAAAMLALIVAGLLAGGWFVFGGQFGARRPEADRDLKRLVVLPFANLGPAEDEYFADGITEEISARLASIDRLRVIGTTSANLYKSRTKSIREIGAELGVDYVLEGSVRWQKSTRGPARVRVTPQLVNTADGMHLWAQVYDEPLDEIFRVQSDIAQKVVQALDVALLEPQRRAVEAIPTGNLEAYDYYLRGNDYMRRGFEERGARAALRMYEKAVELDPRFALAYARLSRMHSIIYLFHYDRSEARLAQAKRAADNAFELEPGLPEAHHAMGDYYFIGYLDYDRALRELAIAAAKRPSHSEIFRTRAVLRMRQGKLRDALADFEKAWQLDPRSSAGASNYGQAYDLLRDFSRAEALYDRALALAPDRPVPYYWKTWLYLRWDTTTQRARAVLDQARTAGLADEPVVLLTRVLVEMFDRKYDEAIGRLSVRAPEVFESQMYYIPRAQLYAQVYGLMRRPDLERAYYDSARSFVSTKLQQRPEDPRLHSALGIAYAGLGRKQEAIQEGEKGVELLPISKEAYRGYYRLWDLARIYAMVGEHDAAVDQLENLLSIPGHLTLAWLRIDPTWNPLRGHPRFQRFLDRGT